MNRPLKSHKKNIDGKKTRMEKFDIHANIITPLCEDCINKVEPDDLKLEVPSHFRIEVLPKSLRNFEDPFPTFGDKPI